MVNDNLTEAVDVEVGVVTGAVLGSGMSGLTDLALAAWLTAAHCLFLSLSIGPQWRGWRCGAEEGRVGGREWGALGWPCVQLKLMVAWPLRLGSLREVFPCRALTKMNSFTEAVRNCEFNLADIFERVLNSSTTAARITL